MDGVAEDQEVPSLVKTFPEVPGEIPVLKLEDPAVMTALFVKPENVLEATEIVLFVSVSVVAFPTKVSVAFGTVAVPEVLSVNVPAPEINVTAVFPLKTFPVNV